MADANVEMYKKLVICYESLSHTLEGKAMSALLSSIVGDFHVSGNKWIAWVFCAGKKASSCKFSDNFWPWKYWLESLPSIQHFNESAGSSRFTFSCLSHLVNYEMAKHWAKKEWEWPGWSQTGWFSPVIKSWLSIRVLSLLSAMASVLTVRISQDLKGRPRSWWLDWLCAHSFLLLSSVSSTFKGNKICLYPRGVRKRQALVHLPKRIVGIKWNDICLKFLAHCMWTNSYSRCSVNFSLDYWVPSKCVRDRNMKTKDSPCTEGI